MEELDELARATHSAPAYTRRPPRGRQSNKAHQFFGGFLVVVGFALWVWGTRLRQDQEFNLRSGPGLWSWLVAVGVGCFIIGTIWFLRARLAGWWRD